MSRGGGGAACEGRPPSPSAGAPPARVGCASALPGPATAASSPASQRPSPLWELKDPSQIKIAGKEQPLIVLRKRSEIRQVSCGVEAASHTAVPAPAEGRLPGTCSSAVSEQNFLLLQPRADDSYLGREWDRCWPWRTMKESIFFF